MQIYRSYTKLYKKKKNWITILDMFSNCLNLFLKYNMCLLKCLLRYFYPIRWQSFVFSYDFSFFVYHQITNKIGKCKFVYMIFQMFTRYYSISLTNYITILFSHSFRISLGNLTVNIDILIFISHIVFLYSCLNFSPVLFCFLLVL